MPYPLSVASAYREGMAWITAAACLCLLASGCSSSPRDYLNENDRLRSENLTLNRTVQKLEKRLDLRLKQIDVLEQRLGGLSQVAGLDPSSARTL